MRAIRALNPPICRAGVENHVDSRRRRTDSRTYHARLGAAVLPAHPFRAGARRRDTAATRLLIVAPMSGNYPTLLRGTVQAFLPNHDVSHGVGRRTHGASCRRPLRSRRLHRLRHHVIATLRVLDGDVHIMTVCQRSVPVIAAVALIEAARDSAVPHSMTLLGGPIDTRINPTVVNRLAERRGVEWFRHNVITKVPFPNPGFMRDVYSGFL